MANFGYAGKPAGFIKIVHILFGAVAIGCGSKYYSEYVFERTFLWGTVTCFVISFLYLLAHLFSQGLVRNGANRGLDIFYHFAGGFLLIIGGSLMIASVKDFEKNHCQPLPWGPPCQNGKTEKLVAGSFSIINGVFYLVAVALIGMHKEEDNDWERGIKGYSAPPQPTRTSGREQAADDRT